MIASLTRIIRRKTFFLRDRRAATAVAMALLAVPLFVTTIAAVNISRVVTARTLLQAAADSAATAGANAWNLSESPAAADTVATATFQGSAANLSGFGTYTVPAPTLACDGANAGTSSVNNSPCDYYGTYGSYYTTTMPSNCTASSAIYCVSVTASVTVNNLLGGFLLPKSMLTVSATAMHGLSTAITGKNIPPSPGFGSAGDVSGIYAYAVPMSGNTSGSTPQFDQMPQADAGCSNYSSTGPLARTDLASSGTTCNYLFIALSTSAGTAGAGGSLTLQTNQPIAFSFINYTGATGYYAGASYTSSSNLYVSTDNGSYAYNQNGTVNGYATSTTVSNCQTSNGTAPGGSTYYNTSSGSGTSSSPYACKSTYLVAGSPTTGYSATGPTGTTSNCTSTVSTGSFPKVYYCSQTTQVVTTATTNYPITGSCPDHTLYGSLDPQSVDTTKTDSNYGKSTANVPDVDRLNVYSSAYEVIGEPPTYETNHALIPFLSTTVVSNGTIAGHTYKVKAICPNYATSGTQIGASISSAYAAAIAKYYGGSGAASWTGLNIYSTAFPGQAYTDSASTQPIDTSGLYSTSSIWMTGNATTDVFPPSVAGCTGSYSADNGGITPIADDPWWNWAYDTTAATASSPGTPNTNSNCSNVSSLTNHIQTAETAGNTITNNAGTSVTTMQPAYGNCALVIQDLGTAGGTTPTVPRNSSNQALLPDYYLRIVTSSGTLLALDPVYDHASWYDLIPGVISGTTGTNGLYSKDSNVSVSPSDSRYVTDTDVAGFVPSSTISYTISSLSYTAPGATSPTTYSNVTVYVEQPANGSDYSLPIETSYQCYNPTLNGNTSGTNGISIQAGPDASPSVVPFTASTGNNPAVTANAIDNIANPQLGAILCNSSVPETYALYWNDLGHYDYDDIGYWNAITGFTCSTPGSTRAGGITSLSG